MTKVLELPLSGNPFDNPPERDGTTPEARAATEAKAQFLIDMDARNRAANGGEPSADTREGSRDGAEEAISLPPRKTKQEREAEQAEIIAAALKAAGAPAEETYDWTADNPYLVVPCQPATAIYRNPFGQVVIRQEGPYPDDDPFVIINPDYLQSVIDKLCDLAGIGSARP